MRERVKLFSDPKVRKCPFLRQFPQDTESAQKAIRESVAHINAGWISCLAGHITMHTTARCTLLSEREMRRIAPFLDVCSRIPD